MFLRIIIQDLDHKLPISSDMEFTEALPVPARSSVIASLLAPTPLKAVNTLEELLRSGLRWGVKNSGGWNTWFRWVGYLVQMGLRIYL